MRPLAAVALALVATFPSAAHAVLGGTADGSQHTAVVMVVVADEAVRLSLPPHGASATLGTARIRDHIRFWHPDRDAPAPGNGTAAPTPQPLGPSPIAYAFPHGLTARPDRDPAAGTCDESSGPYGHEREEQRSDATRIGGRGDGRGFRSRAFSSRGAPDRCGTRGTRRGLASPRRGSRGSARGRRSARGGRCA
jgi:hypothetical protein